MSPSGRDRPPSAQARLAARQPDAKRPQVMHHRWERLLFLHWRVSRESIGRTLPEGLQVDTWEGDAYVAITPFFMRGVRAVGTPPLPWISHFLELNVRTYVYDKSGVPGVWFYSLDCNQPLAVRAARWMTGLPYVDAAMSSATTGTYIDYSCQRAGTDAVARYRYRGSGPSKPADADSLEFFLLERYYLFAQRAGRLIRAQVSHAPYRYRAAEVPEFSIVPAKLDDVVQLAGEPVHSCMADGLNVKVFATQPAG